MMIIKIIINSDVIIIVAGFNSAYFTLFTLYILLYIFTSSYIREILAMN